MKLGRHLERVVGGIEKLERVVGGVEKLKGVHRRIPQIPRVKQAFIRLFNKKLQAWAKAINMGMALIMKRNADKFPGPTSRGRGRSLHSRNAKQSWTRRRRCSGRAYRCRRGGGGSMKKKNAVAVPGTGGEEGGNGKGYQGKGVLREILAIHPMRISAADRGGVSVRTW